MVKLRLSRPTKKQKFKQRDTITRKILIKHHSNTKWYDYGFDERTDVPNTDQEIQEFNAKAETLYERDVNIFNQLQRSKRGSEAAWIATVISKGTAADKKTALELVVRMSPVHSISHVAALVNIIEKRNTREAYSVLVLLKDLFLTDLLPRNRKLISFGSRPLRKLKELSTGNREVLERRLILWKFESDLKLLYNRFINGIEKLATGSIENICTQACRAACDLLMESPEQEQRLLSFLVNKLGYPNRTLATKVSAYLIDLTYRHPNMRGVIVDEVERLIFRKNIPQRTQLYGVGFLSQIRLRGGEHELSMKLLKIYFSLFRILVSKGKLEDKTLSILLSAINRAYPFAAGHADEMTIEVDTLYKVLHQTSFATAVQTLKLLSQLSNGNESSRFYNALYRKMLSKYSGVTAQRQFLDLLYRVLKRDSDIPRVMAFIKRLLQLSLTRNAEYACAALLVVSQLISENPDVLKLSKVAQKTVDDSMSSQKLDVKEEEEHFYDVVDSVEEKKRGGEECKTDMKPSVGSWVHAKNIVLRKEGNTYNRKATNPSFSKADLSVFCELIFLQDHYHPSVSLFASNILKGMDIKYDGDPLSDLNSMRFLDRFVYRNPKVTRSDDGSKIKKNFRKVYNPQGVKKLAVTSKEYVAKAKNEIPVDEQYLHHFVSSFKKEVVDEKLVEESDSDIESVNSEEFDKFLDRMGPNIMDDAFDVDYGKEFSAAGSKNKNRKGSLSEESYNEDDVDMSDGENFNDDSDFDNEELDVEGMSSEGFSSDEKEASNDSSDIDQYLDEEDSGDDSYHYSDKDFAGELGYDEDAAISANKLDGIMEEKDEKLKLKSKGKIRKWQKRKIR